MELVDYEVIDGLSPSAYQAAEPFPHAVLQDLIDPDVLRGIAREFPDPSEMSTQYETALEIKSAEALWERFGPRTRSVIAELNSGTFVRSLERLTGIPGLIVDAGLYGGGQHQIGRNGLLEVHADFNRHFSLGIFRRLNVLVYLNDPWEEAWGGDLELWDRDMPVKQVAPRLGTTVIFTTTTDAMHGHPHPLACPDGVTRKSLALYYYCAEPANELEPDRTTLFRDDMLKSATSRKMHLAIWHLQQAVKSLR